MGGIYKLSKAPQGKDGSATDVMPKSKKIIHAKDLQRVLIRENIPFQFNSKHPLKTIHPQRILSALKDNDQVKKMAEAFYEGFFKTTILIFIIDNNYLFFFLFLLINKNIKNKKHNHFWKLFLVAYWVRNEDLSDLKILDEIIKRAGIEFSSDKLEYLSEEVKETLLKNTQEAVDRGAFGVPFYFIEPTEK